MNPLIIVVIVTYSFQKSEKHITNFIAKNPKLNAFKYRIILKVCFELSTLLLKYLHNKCTDDFNNIDKYRKWLEMMIDDFTQWELLYINEYNSIFPYYCRDITNNNLKTIDVWSGGYYINQ